MSPEDIYRLFEEPSVNPRPVFNVSECCFRQVDRIAAEVTIARGKERRGRLDAVSNAVKLLPRA